MRELTLHGLHDDAEHLVLHDSEGDAYLLRINEAVRAAVRRDRPALGLTQSKEATGLRPKDIQALLRSGHSAEEIAESSGVAVEHVRRYEGPVLAERAYMARQGQQFHLGRGSADALGDVVTARLLARRAEPDPTWDAWRRPDGSWTLLLEFTAGSRARTAEWKLDVPNRVAHAEDDEARWLSDSDDAPAEDSPPRARLRAVRTSVFDVEAADRAVRPGGGRIPTPISEADLDRLNAQRGVRPAAATTPHAGSPADQPGASASPWHSVADADDLPPAQADIGTMKTEQLNELEMPDDLREDLERHRAAQNAAAAEPTDPARTPDAGDQDEQAAQPIDADQDLMDGEAGDPADSPVSAHEDENAEHPASEPPSGASDSDAETADPLEPLPGFTKPDRAPEPKKRKGRASIPSWDDIVFGARDK